MNIERNDARKVDQKTLNSSILKLSFNSGNSEFSRFKILCHILDRFEDIFGTIVSIKSLDMFL
jgi:hypothetical protein